MACNDALFEWQLILIYIDVASALSGSVFVCVELYAGSMYR